MQYGQTLLNMLVSANPGWSALGLFLAGLLVLEIERHSTRGRRRRGLRHSPFAPVLDGMALLLWLGGGMLIITAVILPAVQGISSALLAPILWLCGLVVILAVGGSLLQRVAHALPRSSESGSASNSLLPATQLNSAQSVAFAVPALTPERPSSDQSRVPPWPAGYETPFSPARPVATPPQSAVWGGRPAPTSPVRARIQAQLQTRSSAYQTTQLHMRWIVGVLALALLMTLVLAILTSGGAFQGTYPSGGTPLPQNSIASPHSPVRATEEFTTRRVKEAPVEVRVNPGANQPVIQTLPAGTEVRVLPDERLIRASVWVKVRIGLIEGWVSQSALE